MASDIGFVEYVVDQMRDAGTISQRKMFGEYAVYCDGKVVALVTDDALFVKPTDAGRAFIGQPAEVPPYPGAQPYFAIEDKLDDQRWVSALIRATTDELPAPKHKKPRARKPAAG